MANSVKEIVNRLLKDFPGGYFFIGVDEGASCRVCNHTVKWASAFEEELYDHLRFHGFRELA
jgi:hypothetical protein